MAAQHGSAAARRLELGTGRGPANLRSLLATGPVPNPQARITDVHDVVEAANDGDDYDLDAEKTLTWERLPTDVHEAVEGEGEVEVEVEVEIDLSDLSDLAELDSLESLPAPANEPPVAAPQPTSSRVHLVIGGLGLVATVLAFMAVFQSQPHNAAALPVAPQALASQVLVPVSPEPQPQAPAPLAIDPVDPGEPEADDEELLLVIDDADLVDEDEAESPGDTEGDTDDAASVAKRRRARRLKVRGDRALGQGDRDGAIALYEQALQADPSYAAAAGQISEAYFDQGRFDFAVDYAEEAVKADFDDPDHHVTLGDAYVRIGAIDDARLQYRTASKLGSARGRDRLRKLQAKQPR